MIIYKYIDSDGALKTIKNNSVLLRMPDEYNDPFDCLFDSNEKERVKAFKLFMNYHFFKRFYTELIVNNKTLIFGEKYTKLVKKTILTAANIIKKTKKYKFQPDIAMYYQISKMVNKKNHNSDSNLDENKIKETFDKEFNEVLEKIRTSIVMCCFSLKNDSVLMWSHYAKNHSGACIEFEIHDEDFKRVRYSKKLTNFELTKAFEIALGHDFVGEEIDYNDNQLQFALKPVLTKYTDWKYEREVRCGYSAKKPNDKIHLGTDDDGNPIKLLEMPTIRRIYLGCNADNKFIEDVKREHKDIPLFRMVREKGKYNLVAEPLQDQD